MPGKPAATITDRVAHAAPPVLTLGPGSADVLIDSLPAWRAMPHGAVNALLQLKSQSNAQITAAENATRAATGTPGQTAAQAAEETLKAATLGTMQAAIQSASGNADIHMCSTPLPTPPHGAGVVIDGSSSVLINSLPACRQSDRILEALGPFNSITGGEPSVLIGD